MSQTIKMIGLIFAIISANLPVRALGGNSDCETFGEYASSYRADTMCVEINFRFDDAMVLRDFKNNNASFSRIESLMRDINSIDSISIVGFTSPDGLSAYNLSLARQRAEAMRNYLHWCYPDSRSVSVTLRVEQDLATALAGYIKEDNNVPRREKVLEILSDQRRSLDTRIANLKLIAGDSYDYINRKIFPRMRMSTSYLLYYKTPIAASEAVTSPCADTSCTATDRTTAQQEQAADVLAQATATDVSAQATSATDRTTAQQEQAADDSAQATSATDRATAQQEQAADALAPTASGLPADAAAPINAVGNPISHTYKPLFALKTNLLFDALTILNIGIEVPIGPRWSVAGEWMFPWWLSNNKQRALQVMSGTVEGKYWFGDRERRPDGRPRQQLTGWFAGLYAGGGYYDLEWNHTGYQGEFFIAAGVSGGYAHTINKCGNLRMEYSLGIGYLQTNYRKYEAKIGSDEQWHLYRRAEGKYKWFGPTSVKVSLVWMLNHKQKGGSK